MTELESLVQEMDEAQIPLETLLEKFTRGKTLLNFCQSRLDQAQQCVEMVSAQADGSATTQPFAVPTSVGNAPPQDDIRLS